MDDAIKQNSATFNDTLFLKDGKIHTGIVVQETPRVVIINENGEENQFKRMLVKKIYYYSQSENKRVKHIDERTFKRYENYPIDLQQAKINVAVHSLSPKGVAPNTADVLSEAFRAHLSNEKRFNVMERSNMADILEEQEFLQTDVCDASSCAVEIGQLLGVERIIVGSIGKVSETWSINVRMVSVESGEILFDITEQYKGTEDKLLTKIMPLLAKKIAGTYRDKKRNWLIFGGTSAAAALSLSAYLFWFNDKPEVIPDIDVGEAEISW